MNGDAESRLAPILDVAAIYNQLAKQSEECPTSDDIAREQLKMLKTAHENYIDESLRKYKEKHLVGKASGTVRAVNSLKERGIPSPSRIKGMNKCTNFSEGFRAARKGSNLNTKESTLSYTEVNFGIFMVGRRKATSDSKMWERGDTTPQKPHFFTDACVFMNISNKDTSRLVDLYRKKNPNYSKKEQLAHERKTELSKWIRSL